MFDTNGSLVRCLSLSDVLSVGILYSVRGITTATSSFTGNRRHSSQRFQFSKSNGNPKFSMIATLAGCILNIILDPIAIFELHWGMMGAAVAIITGQVVTAILCIAYMVQGISGQAAIDMPVYFFRTSLLISGFAINTLTVLHG